MKSATIEDKDNLNEFGGGGITTTSEYNSNKGNVGGGGRVIQNSCSIAIDERVYSLVA